MAGWRSSRATLAAEDLGCLPAHVPHGERGFTLVEVMVAIMILLVGVLGVVSMVDGANAVTSKTKAREGGTNSPARSSRSRARSATAT